MGKPRNIGPDIVNLRDKGYTYSQIITELGCAKSTISYHIGANEKKLSMKRQKKYRMIDFYRRAHEWDFNTAKSKALLKEHGSRVNVIKWIYEIKQNGCDPYTGKPLLKKTHLDHRKPKSKNGSNEITNCDILNPVTNQAKSDMSSKEFIDFCISVVEFNGFKVTPQI